jgi:hypothetical protein
MTAPAEATSLEASGTGQPVSVPETDGVLIDPVAFALSATAQAISIVEACAFALGGSSPAALETRDSKEVLTKRGRAQALLSSPMIGIEPWPMLDVLQT